MWKSVSAIFTVICMATVVSELLAVGFFWYRGQLSMDTVTQIRNVINGDDGEELVDDEDDNNGQPSTDEVIRQRAMRILALNTRREELGQFKAMISDRANSLIKEQKAFENKKKQFEEQLSQLGKTLNSEATDQARGIVLKSRPADAVQNLMSLTLEENIVILKGLPEKDIAKLLQEFSTGPEEQLKRGQEIFDAIARGEPSQKLIEETAAGLAPQKNPAGS